MAADSNRNHINASHRRHNSRGELRQLQGAASLQQWRNVTRVGTNSDEMGIQPLEADAPAQEEEDKPLSGCPGDLGGTA